MIRRLSLPLALFLLVALAPAAARADVTSWFSLGGGPVFLGQEIRGRTQFGVLQMEVGVGSPPDKAVIVGGLFKSLTLFGAGTDLGFTLRGATGGFTRGGWGFAIDAGGYLRNWGEGSSGFLGGLVLGGVYGVQLTGFTEQGSHDNHAYGVLLGIDFLRLTVYRTASQSYMPNPILPSGVTR